MEKYNIPVRLRQSFTLIYIIHQIILPCTYSFITTKPATSLPFICEDRNNPRDKPTTTTSLNMVFDFFKKRAEEGVAQLENLATSAKEGRLSEGLLDAATYTQQSNQAFAAGLAKSRNKLLYDLDSLINNQGVDFLDDLEDVLIQADIGITTADDVMDEVRSLRLDSETFLSRDDLRSILRGKLLEALESSDMERNIKFSTTENQPTVLFVMGANGMGKTTTIGKLASRLTVEGNQKVMLAACDTFRAAAVEQLEMWANRANVTCFSPTIEGDSGDRKKATSPSAVLYSALDKAINENYDTVIVDTSGRLSNNDALTAELVKMKKVIQNKFSTTVDEETGKNIPNMNVPHETLLVIDAAQGRMALDSAKQWHKELGLTGLVLTKLDGSAKGGSVVAVSRDLSIPVKLVGVGEGINDLRDFEPESFVDSLLGIGTAGGSTAKNAKDEGAALAKRLEDLRRNRDERTKELMKKTPPKSTSGPSVPAMPDLSLDDLDIEEDGDDDGIQVITQTKSKAAKSKNKKKKKKKKKGKR